MVTTTEKPLFVPLKKEYFLAFKSGTKHSEFRKEGPRWNDRTCRVGREVILSNGYGKHNRLHGKIIATSTIEDCTFPDFCRIYGAGNDCRMISIRLLSKAGEVN